MEFIRCSLADRHFCDLNTGLFHIDTSPWCITAIFSRTMTKLVTTVDLPYMISLGTRPITLTGLWGISFETPTTMEIKCKDCSHVQTLQPPFTVINLQPACSAFSSTIKLLPYFKWYSEGFHVALKSGNLYIPKFTPSSFRIWTFFRSIQCNQTWNWKFEEACISPRHSHQPIKSPNCEFLGVLPLTQTNLGFTMLEEVQDLV